MPPFKLKGLSMRCVTPMMRIYNKEEPRSGKIISRQEAMKILEADKNGHRKKLNKLLPYNYAWQMIPCKKCWACQLNYSAEWATRIMLEAKKDECNWFITLTYDDVHLPIAEKIELPKNKKNPNGKIYENDGTWTGTLYEQHMITFLNTLRKDFERRGYEGIKYFYCGEYGEKTHRPHYHIILLHCPLEIKEFYNCHVDTNYKAHWKSHQLEKWWKYGILDIAELEWSCAAYVARYCAKKISFDTDKTEYYENGKMPEFIRMSKGIGFDYFKENLHKIYDTDEIIMRTVQGNIGSAKPPKAFDRKLEQINPEMLEKIKESRKKAQERADKLKSELSDYTDYENLIMAAEKVKKKMKLLPRVGEW